jgi:PAS domain S-box-containing protein
VLEPNRIYVAPPDHHLIVADGTLRVVRGPHENGHRPAIDPLFRSAALPYREGAIGVVLSGALDDGAAGSAAISHLGGSVLVQDPSDAAFPDMPRNAIVADRPHAVLPLEELGAAVVGLVHTPPDGGKEAEVGDELRQERDYATLSADAISRKGVFSELAPFACPSCGGSLWEAPDDENLHFRCRIGHAEARLAAYKEKQLEDLPEGLRDRYFLEANGAFVFRSDIRRAVIFGRNDLLQDPPISRVDQRRVFVKNPTTEADARMPRLQQRTPEAFDEPQDGMLREASFDQAPIAQVVVDTRGRVVSINYAARAIFGMKTSDVGRPLQDLEISYRPLELRSVIEQVQTERRVISNKEVEWAPTGGRPRQLDVQVAPLTDPSGRHAGASISYADVSRYHSLAAELDQARRDLETAYEELQSTVEELETTNEELQSTNEELETTNEELQSTNEELETMNEELQSTNEELEAMNDELRDRTDEALQANSFLSSILSSVEQAVIVVDPELRILKWSPAASEVWGLREDEVEGHHLLNLDIDVPVGELRESIREVLVGSSPDPVRLDGNNRRGQAVRFEVTFTRLRSHLDELQGVILVMTAEKAEV